MEQVNWSRLVSPQQQGTVSENQSIGGGWNLDPTIRGTRGWTVIELKSCEVGSWEAGWRQEGMEPVMEPSKNGRLLRAGPPIFHQIWKVSSNDAKKLLVLHSVQRVLNSSIEEGFIYIQTTHSLGDEERRACWRRLRTFSFCALRCSIHVCLIGLWSWWTLGCVGSFSMRRCTRWPDNSLGPIRWWRVIVVLVGCSSKKSWSGWRCISPSCWYRSCSMEQFVIIERIFHNGLLPVTLC